MRAGVQHYFNKTFLVQGSLKVGARSRTRAYIPPDRDGVPINWINWHEDNPSGNPFIFENEINEPASLGIHSYPIHDESIFYTNVVLSAGWKFPIVSKVNAELLGGFGLRYTDYHSIGESGDAIFKYNGTEYLIYYLIPVYQRGIDGHLNFELSLIYPFSKNLSLRGGLQSDFTLGSSNLGVGNYYSVGLSLLVKL